MPKLILRASVALALGAAPRLVVAQDDSTNVGGPPVATLRLLGSDAEDRLRIAQLRGRASDDGYMLRSLSSLSARQPRAEGGGRWALIPPELYLIKNTRLPYSLNDGPLWAGRGFSSRISAGFSIDRGRWRLTVLPEVTAAENRAYQLLRPESFFLPPPLPPDRSVWSYPWRVEPLSIDYPLRFGPSPLQGVDVGQSSLVFRVGAFETGIAHENQWWGPAIRNGLVLTNNAPGFPHLFLRTGRPLDTRVGAFEGRWLVGGLSESDFFDANPQNDLRSLSALGVTWKPVWTPGLTLGVARAVYEPVLHWELIPGRWFRVFKNTGRPNDVADTVKGTTYSADQLISFFARFLLPDDGVEAYVEWARASFPKNLRDFLVQPHHSQGYTLGLQHARPAFGLAGLFRLQAEITFLEQSSTFRDRPIGSWYTSHAVPQGYTQRGQPLGAAIGPGASSQYVGMDYIAERWQFGAFAGRVRWDDDSRWTISWPDYKGWCEDDVSVLPGVRGGLNGAWGRVTAEMTWGARYNVFFDNETACPRGPLERNERNETFRLTFSPWAPLR